MIQTCRERQNLARHPLDDVCRRLAVLGRTLKQMVVESLPELALPCIFSGQVLDPLHQKFRYLAREVEHELGRHPQVAGRLGV